MVDFEDASKEYTRTFKQQDSLWSIKKEHVISFLQCYGKIKKLNVKFPLELKKCIREEKWLRTRLGDYRPLKEFTSRPVKYMGKPLVAIFPKIAPCDRILITICCLKLFFSMRIFKGDWILVWYFQKCCRFFLILNSTLSFRTYSSFPGFQRKIVGRSQVFIQISYRRIDSGELLAVNQVSVAIYTASKDKTQPLKPPEAAPFVATSLGQGIVNPPSLTQQHVSAGALLFVAANTTGFFGQ